MKSGDGVVLANSLALTAAILWVICTVIIAILPDFSLEVTKWWMHGLDMSVMGEWNLSLINFLLGGITLTATAWVGGYVFGFVRNMVGKR